MLLSNTEMSRDYRKPIQPGQESVFKGSKNGKNLFESWGKAHLYNSWPECCAQLCYHIKIQSIRLNGLAGFVSGLSGEKVGTMTNTCDPTISAICLGPVYLLSRML